MAPDRFAYLKLHGTVGIFATEEEGFSPAPDVPRVVHNQERIPSLEAIDDQLVCDQGNALKHPLIVFPHEKPLLGEYPDNRTSFREYIPAIWTAARKIMQSATSIEFTGYSFPDADLHGENSLMSLLTAATSCRQIVVRNIDPERVANRIRDALPGRNWRIELRKGRLEDR